MKTEKEKAFVIGFAAGDALGVPVEFATRGQLQKQPIKSSGYVVDTLETAVWCIFYTSTYKLRCQSVASNGRRC